MKSRLMPGALGTFGFLLLVSVFQTSSSVSILRRSGSGPPPPGHPAHFMHRFGPVESLEEDSEEDDNESQARVEPHITSLNRDECLAKLLCGMSVPVTGNGAPKNGYYSEYANIVAKFFEAFPPNEEEKQSAESLEAYDDYSVEESKESAKPKPSRVNSKASGGLQLFELARITQASNSTGLKLNDVGRREARNVDLRIKEARKIVAKLGEKLQTVRQCQQISGCPFTFKQLRSKLKNLPAPSKPKVSSVPSSVQVQAQPKPKPESVEVQSKPKPEPLELKPQPTASQPTFDLDIVDLGPEAPPPVKYTYDTNNYKAPSKKKPAPVSTEVSLGDPVLPFQDSQKGDDELEEFFGPPPLSGSGRPAKKPLPLHVQPGQQPVQIAQQIINQAQQEHIPYIPPVRRGSTAQVQSGFAFPKRKVEYKGPQISNQKNTGENDEFDDVNKSTGPITLIGGEESAFPPQRPVQQQGTNVEEQSNQTDDEEDENDYDDDAEEDYDYGDGEGGGESDGEEEEEEEDDYGEEDEEGEDEENDDDDDDKPKEKTKDSDSNKATDDVQETLKNKIKQYKIPPKSSKEALLFIEDDFPAKPNKDDDEAENLENAGWSKLKFATSSALIKEPKNKKKTELEKKNDEKLGLSKEETSSEEVADEESKEEEEEEDDVDKSRSQPKEKEADVVEESKQVQVQGKAKPNTEDDEAEEEKARMKKPKRKNSNYNKNKSSIKKDKPKGSKKGLSKGKNKKDKNKKDSKPKKTQKPHHDSSVESSEAVRQRPQPLLEIGGRPIVPLPEKDLKQNKKATGLSRFKFSLVRPQGVATTGEYQASSYLHSMKAQLPSYQSPLPSYPSNKGPSNSFRNDMIGTPNTKTPSSSSYASSSSFMPSSNNVKPEFQSGPSMDSQYHPQGSGFVTFPLVTGPLSTLKTLFNLPSKSKYNRETPLAQPPAPVNAFMYRPAGPESNTFKKDKPGQGQARLEQVVTKPKNRRRSDLDLTSKPKKYKPKKSKKSKKSKPTKTTPIIIEM